MAPPLHPLRFNDARWRMTRSGRTVAFACVLMMAPLTFVFEQGCADEGSLDSGQGRFTPGENDIVTRKDDSKKDEECKAGVCPPAKQSAPPDPGSPQGSPPSTKGDGGGDPGKCEKKNTCTTAT